MQKAEINYDPYRIKTTVKVEGRDVRDLAVYLQEYLQFCRLTEKKVPLQAWLKPVPGEHWKGLVNELKADDCSEKIQILFHGRKVDFEDLRRICEAENGRRIHKLAITYEHGTELSDKKLTEDIDSIMETLRSEEFLKLAEEQGQESRLAEDCRKLEKEYRSVREGNFKNQPVEEETGTVKIETPVGEIICSAEEYLTRYAYPSQVRNFMEIFDAFTQDIDAVRKKEREQLKQKREEAGKNESQIKLIYFGRWMKGRRIKELNALKREAETVEGREDISGKISSANRKIDELKKQESAYRKQRKILNEEIGEIREKLGLLRKLTDDMETAGRMKSAQCGGRKPKLSVRILDPGLSPKKMARRAVRPVRPNGKKETGNGRKERKEGADSWKIR